MSRTIVVGMQWGDEGKGKVVDLICPAFGVVARYQGGHNAGHTVKFGDRHFALHLIPSGILREGTRCVLGSGMVVNPEAFFEELEGLQALGVEPGDRLFVSERAHVLFPYFAELDQRREGALGASKVGTTSRGIGPAYELKASRLGLRLGDLAAGDLEDRLRIQLLRVEPELERLGGTPPGEPGPLADRCRSWASRLAPYLRDTEALLNRWLEEGESVLFEGAQGTLLDIDHGTYPYVTSSSSCAGGAAVGTGVAPTRIDGVLGVLKAYTTRVGEGPFVTELHDETGAHLQRRGNEVGTTTGRPRRCGWLDAVAARYARTINGVDSITLTKLDVLDELEEIKICVAYRVGGEEVRDFPAGTAALESAEPVYRTFKGWQQSTDGTLRYEDLPPRARDYVTAIEEEVGAPIGLISTGPRREETILRNETRFVELTEGMLDRPA